MKRLGGDWKHSKFEIDGWLTRPEGGDSKFEIKVKKGEGEATNLDSTDENDLIDLFDYLKNRKSELLKYKSQTKDEKVTLTLKKDQDNNWSVVQDAATIRNWIINIVGKKENLKLYEDGNDQDISNINDEKELDQLKTAIESYKKDKEDQGVIVFEKYYDSSSSEVWMHVEEALDKLIDSIGDSLDLDQVKIQIDDGPEEKAKGAGDEKLIGLLKHIQTEWNNYKCKDYLTLKKNNGKWKEIKGK